MQLYCAFVDSARQHEIVPTWSEVVSESLCLSMKGNALKDVLNAILVLRVTLFGFGCLSLISSVFCRMGSVCLRNGNCTANA